jgi:hypothetical protein
MEGERWKEERMWKKLALLEWIEWIVREAEDEGSCADNYLFLPFVPTLPLFSVRGAHTPRS